MLPCSSKSMNTGMLPLCTSDNLRICAEHGQKPVVVKVRNASRKDFFTFVALGLSLGDFEQEYAGRGFIGNQYHIWLASSSYGYLESRAAIIFVEGGGGHFFSCDGRIRLYAARVVSSK